MVAYTATNGVLADNTPDLRQPIVAPAQAGSDSGSGASTRDNTQTHVRTDSSEGRAAKNKANQSKYQYSSAKIKRDRWIAYRLAKYNWLDKVAEADPSIIEAIASHRGPAKVLAEHRHLDRIAAADHYLCRRLTRWNGATDALIKNPHFDVVAGYDPAGIYYAMNRRPLIARRIAKVDTFNLLPDQDRGFNREMSLHIK